MTLQELRDEKGELANEADQILQAALKDGRTTSARTRTRSSTPFTPTRGADGAVHDHDGWLHGGGRDDARHSKWRCWRSAACVRSRPSSAPATAGRCRSRPRTTPANKGAILAENTQVSTRLGHDVRQLVLDAYKYSSKSCSCRSSSCRTRRSTSRSSSASARRAHRRIQNDHFTTGTGSSQPNGIVTAATSSRDRFGDRDGDLRQPRGPDPLGGSGVPQQRALHVP
jgi:hypothetical protein